ncbi:MAG: anthranilate synthase component I family protein, partial [Candidatus Planktophila sp.]
MNTDYQFWMGGRLATSLEEITQDPKKLDGEGFWTTVVTFEGVPTFARFGKVEEKDFPESEWEELHTEWVSSQNQDQYEMYVSVIREEISRGS